MDNIFISLVRKMFMNWIQTSLNLQIYHDCSFKSYMCQRSVQQRGTVLVTQLMPLLRTSVYPCLQVVYFDLGRGPDEWHAPRDFEAFSIWMRVASLEPTRCSHFCMWKLTPSRYSFLFETTFMVVFGGSCGTTKCILHLHYYTLAFGE